MIRKKDGYTLMEIIIAVGIASLVLLAFSMIYTQFQKILLKNTARTDLTREARQYMDSLQMHLRNATKNSVQITSPDNRMYSRLEFTLTDGRRVRYFLRVNPSASTTVGHAVVEEIESASGSNTFQAKTISTRAAFLTFTASALDPGSVRMSLRLIRHVGNRNETVDLLNQTIRVGPP